MKKKNKIILIIFLVVFIIVLPVIISDIYSHKSDVEQLNQEFEESTFESLPQESDESEEMIADANNHADSDNNAEKNIDSTTESSNIDTLLSQVAESGDKYICMDINGDSTDELIVLSGVELNVYDLNNDDIVYEGTEYEIPINSGNLIGILYHRDGGAPTHVDYQFTSFNEDFETTTIEFSWYDSNEDGQKDSDDLYLTGDDEIDMASWIEEYSLYEDISTQEITWQDIK